MFFRRQPAYSEQGPYRILAGLCLLLSFFTSCAGGPTAADLSVTPGTDTHILKTDKFYDLLTWDNKALVNNCWGTVYIQHPELASTSVSYDPAASLCSWRWSWPEEAVSELKGYPSLVVGDKAHGLPNSDATTDARFPLRLRRIDSLLARGDIRATGSGAFDFAFDLLFLENAHSSPEAIRSEIMVWLVSSIPCAATKRGEYIIDGRVYDFFVNTEWHPEIPYLAFVLKEGAPPRRLPLHEFIRIGIETGYVDPDGWLAAVELGPEIWWGDGEATVRDYGISLNGD
jgi:hypothetical protein